jgi:ELWxxDGT repeat protein
MTQPLNHPVIRAARVLVLLLTLPLFAATTAPYLVKDLPGPIASRGSLGSLWFTSGNTSWFTADSGDGFGLQIWKTDGTESGTVRVTNVKTTGVHAETFIGFVNGHILYGGDDGQGPVLLSLDVNGGPPETIFREKFSERGIVYNGLLYMAAPARVDGGGIKGVELWRTDGTFEGTTFADLNPGNPSSLFSDSLALAGDFIIFAGETPAGKGIYRTDGTEDGTALLLALPSNAEPSQVQLTQFGNRVVFVLPQLGVQTNQLWVTDGTSAGTQPFVERMTAFIPGGVLDGRLLFTMRKNNQLTMWTTDGTAIGTKQLNDHSGSIGTIGIPGAVAGGKYFFFSTDPQTSHSALFTSGALPGTTQKVTDLETLRLGGGAWNGRFFFANREAAYGTEWWVSDGTAAGTYRIGDFAAGSRSGVISDQMLERPDGLLVGVDGTFGYEPWIIDGTAAGSRMLKNIGIDTPLPGSNPEELSAAGPRLFFLADGPGSRVVGHSDGNAEGTNTEVITPTDEWWFADAFGSGSRYYLNSGQLISTDGTPLGTEHLSSDAGTALAFRGGVVFEERGDHTFHFSDGTAVGTNTIAPLAGPPPAGWKLYVANDRVWFTNGSTLAVSNGTSPMQQVLSLTNALGPIREVAAGPNATYFVDENFADFRLWRTDGTSAGTQIVRTFTQPPANFIATSDRLLFTLNSVLFSTDGTTANTVSLGAPGASVSCNFGSGNEPVVVGNQLYWYVRRNDGTSALWKSNGTLAGTSEVATFAASSPACVTMAALDGRVYFRGFDSEHGAEPWVTDGTNGGTRLVTDLYPGTKGSDPRELTTAGNHLYFSAETPDRGRELWAIRQITRRRAVDH